MDVLNRDISELNLGETADFLKELKDLKGNLNNEISKINKIISNVETKLKIKLDELGTDIVRGKTVTVSISKSEVPKVEDWESFYEYIMKNNAPYLLQRRPSAGPIREIWSSGQEVSGVEIVPTTTLNTKSLT